MLARLPEGLLLLGPSMVRVLKQIILYRFWEYPQVQAIVSYILRRGSRAAENLFITLMNLMIFIESKNNQKF